MGTRPLTKIYNDENKLLVTMYRQMDGYPSGHGHELAEFLSPIILINGVRISVLRATANGMGCLAAQIIAHFKREPGDIYIVKPGDHGQEYVYEVHTTGLIIKNPRWRIFSGTWEEARVFTKNYK